jgi:ABC-type phosphate transport system substrate-binding protein
MSKLNFLLFVLTFLIGAVSAETREIAIIINTRSPINSLSLEEVKGIYLGEIRLIRGRRFKPIDQHENKEIRQAFLKHVLEMSQASYLKHWIHRIFQEGIDAPILRENSSAVIETVRGSEEAIGYVWADDALDAGGIKIVLTLPEVSSERKSTKQSLMS